MNRTKKYALILMALSMPFFPLFGAELNIVADIPLGGNERDSICSGMTLTDTGDIYLIGRAMNNTTENPVWLSRLNSKGVEIYNKSISLPAMQLRYTWEGARGIYSHNDSLLALLEWSTPDTRGLARSLAIAELDLTGEMREWLPLPFDLQFTQMANIDPYTYVLIGENQSTKNLETYRFAYPDISRATRVSTSYEMKEGAPVTDSFALDSDTLILLCESSIFSGPVQIRLIQLSLSTGTVTELDILSGGSGSLMKSGEKEAILSYRAQNKEWSPGEMGDWLGEERARVYSLPKMSTNYDVSLVCTADSNTNVILPVFSINKSHYITGALASTNGSIGSCRVLSERTTTRLKQQFCVNGTQYLLADELERKADPERPSKSILYKRSRLLITSLSSIEEE
jgi:hypothetical protein